MMKTAILPFAALFALTVSPACAAELRPDQKAAVEKLLAGMEPSMREPFRAQIEQSVAMLNKEQVAALVASMGENAPAEPEEEKQAAAASPEDLAYNRAQFEPAIRRNWEAQKAFDTFVDGEMAAKCPDRHVYAVVDGPARYELRPLSPTWPRASGDVETDVTVIAGSYAPQDGRYDFDFSEVRTSFDKGAVSAAIAKACADWAREGAAFQAKARALVDAGKDEAAFELERAAYGKADAIETPLNAVLGEQAPSANYALINALMNGRPAK